MVVSEELGRNPVGATIGSSLNADMTTHFMVAMAAKLQKRQWLPGVVTGDVIQATALTEPESGSDAAAIRTTAIRDGDHYVINGNKCFISNGSERRPAVCHREDRPGSPGGGISMFLVPGDTPGVTRRKTRDDGISGRRHVRRFSFENARFRRQSAGPEGDGLKMFQPCISLDRMQICARSLGAAESAFEMTLEYVKQRRIFGQRLIDFQNTQFKLAEIETEIRPQPRFHGGTGPQVSRRHLTDIDTSMLKIWMPEMEFRVLDTCLQFWGGSGWMDAKPISRMFTAARVQRIYAGATELQKSLVARRYLRRLRT